MNQEGGCIKMKNKKGAIEIEKVVAAALILLVLVVLIMVFSKLFGKEAKTAEGHIDNLGNDCDCDGTPNLIDKCPYDPDVQLKGDCKKTKETESCKC